MQADGAVAARRYGHGRGARAVDARRTHKRRTELLQLMLCLCYAPLSGDDDAFSLPPLSLSLYLSPPLLSCSSFVCSSLDEVLLL